MPFTPAIQTALDNYNRKKGLLRKLQGDQEGIAKLKQLPPEHQDSIVHCVLCFIDHIPSLKQASYAVFLAVLEGLGINQEWIDSIGFNPVVLREKILAQLFILMAKIGDVATLEHLAEQSYYGLATLIRSHNYMAFDVAVQNGHRIVLEFFHQNLRNYEANVMYELRADAAMSTAAKNGHLDICQHFAEKVPNQFQVMVKANNYGAFRQAAQSGHLDIMDYLVQQAPDVLQEMLEADKYDAFRQAAQNGYLNIMVYLINLLAPKQRNIMIAAVNYYAFRLAAAHGHLNVMKYLATLVTSTRLQVMIEAKDYEAFRKAAINGHLEIMKYLAQQAPEKLQVMLEIQDYPLTHDRRNRYMTFCKVVENGHLNVAIYFVSLAVLERIQVTIKANNYKIFREIAANGLISIMEYLTGLLSIEARQAMIEAKSYRVFRVAARHGHLKMLQYLVSLMTPEKLQAMIEAKNYEAFRLAVCDGHLKILQYLVSLVTPEKLQAMIEAENYGAFRLAATYGHLHILHYIASLVTPESLQVIIQAENYKAFQRAAINGHLSILKYLAQQAPKKLQAMIQAENYQAFQKAAISGHLSILKYLAQQAPKKLQAMIQAENYQAFRGAALNGHLNVLEYLAQQAPKKLQAMIEAENYEAFKRASYYEHLHIIQYLVKEMCYNKLVDIKVKTLIRANYRDIIKLLHKTVKERDLDGVKYLLKFFRNAALQQVVESHEYGMFSNAAATGFLDLMKYLVNLTPQNSHAMIKAANYRAFHWAASNNHPSVLQYLVEQAPAELQDMIEADSYHAFFSAAHDGHLNILRYLTNLVTPEKIQDMIKAGHYRAFSSAVKNGHLDVLNYLLKISNYEFFDWVEKHDDEYGPEATYEYVDESISDLEIQKQNFETANSNTPFSIEDDAAKKYFYMARNMIRRSAPGHTAPTQANEHLQNLEFLLSIPTIKNLCALSINLGERNELLILANSLQNTRAAELLMRIPAVRELAARNNYYRTTTSLDLRQIAQDDESSMRALNLQEQKQLESLQTKYQPFLDSAGIKNIIDDLKNRLAERHAKESDLPLEWDQFQALKLSSEERAQALIAYYQNEDHTAFRFLSKPNHWIAQQAFFVQIDPNNRQHRWASFENYLDLIALFYVAATDSHATPIEGHTLESRLSFFISQLALINRVHNWDKTRLTASAQLEEYDDQQPDKPSCYSGIKRRLFLSLVGHPTFDILTKDKVDQELRDFVRAHFRTTIHKHENLSLLQEAYNEYSISLDRNHLETLKCLNILPEAKTKFLQDMKQKYGAQFEGFYDYVNKKFNPGHDLIDAIRFDYVGLSDLLGSMRGGMSNVRNHPQ